MSESEIINIRLINQQISGTVFKSPAEIVKWMGAMQAQEYSMAKWAIGLRLPGVKETDVENAFNRGEILRTHLLRPTWHFVSPSDIRWMLKLTSPRVHAANAYMYKKMELDTKIFKRSNDLIIKTMGGGKNFTREQLQTELKKKKIAAEGIRLVCLMMYAELEGIICSGPRQGKQFTYSLLDERAPYTKTLNHEEALAELVKRYLISHGPATLQDFVYWSGLTLKDAKVGYESVKKEFMELEKEKNIYIHSKTATNKIDKDQCTFLMPEYDEFVIGYKNRDDLYNSKNGIKEINNRKIIFNRLIILNGKIKGAWKRELKKDKVNIEIQALSKISKNDLNKITKASHTYAEFLGKEINLQLTSAN